MSATMERLVPGSRGFGLWAVLLLTLCTVFSRAQTARPVISKVDPPNWFTQLPDSVLLVHGENLQQTRFSLRHTDARITEQSLSANGHWAFLTIATAKAAPGTLNIVATNRMGSVSVPYTLSARRKVSEQPRGFNSADVLYLVMPDRFADGDLTNDRVAGFRDPDDRTLSRAYHGGDLIGIEQHLDYLQKLGVTTIWTTPLYDNTANQSGQTYHGYSATDMYGVDPHFGTMASYKALVDAAHARGMKVILDTVPNHVGPATPWAKDPPRPTWLHGSPAAHIKVDDDFASILDVKAPEARRDVLLDGWFADVLPDLNQDDPFVARYLVQNAVWWIESAGLDGLRIDTFPYVPRSFWHDYNQFLHALYPRLSDVGEIFNGDPKVTSFFAGGRANTGSDGTYDTLLDTPFDYPLYFTLRHALTHHAPMTAIADVLTADALYPHPERLVTFFGNHDTLRFLSEPGASPAALHLAYGLLATLRGTPQLYYGDEIGMAGGDDPDNRKDFPGGFPSDKADAFSPQGRTEAQQGMEHWVEQVMQLRLHTPALQSGLQVPVFADLNTLAFVRSLAGQGGCSESAPGGRFLVVVNNDSVSREIRLPSSPGALAGCTRLRSALDNGASATIAPGGLQVRLGAQEIGVFEALP